MNCPECGEEIINGAAFCSACGAKVELDTLGPYELRGVLGRGAMAKVWRAWDPNLEREVAIKEPLIDPNLPEGVRDEMARRFVREAKTAARLQHPGIVTIHAANIYNGRPAIVMELVDGATLSDLLEVGSLEPSAVLDALDQLLDAVGYAHSEGVVHRDIKPDNIFVNKEGRLKLADFGIARTDDNATKATVAGTVLGTPGYMSPEQAKGQNVDARSDLFSIGVVAYEMLAGHHPFGVGDGADSTILLYRIVYEEPDELPESSFQGLSADVRPAVKAALAKDPNSRPQSAAAFKAMLHGEEAPSTSAQTSNLAQATTVAAESKKKPKWLPYVVVGVVCIAILAVVFFMAGAHTGGGSSQSATAAYLAVKDGKVAIFTSGGAEPYRITDIAVADLDDEAAAALDAHISFTTVAEAETKVSEYALAAASAKEAAAKKAAEDEAKQEAAQQAAAQQRAEQEALSLQNSSNSSSANSLDIAQLTVMNPHTNREETVSIRRSYGECVIPDSDVRAYSRAEIEAMNLTDAELYIARNEIVAKTGYTFKNVYNSRYFTNNCSWYKPVNTSYNLTGVLGSNAGIIAEIERDRGSWYLDIE